MSKYKLTEEDKTEITREVDGCAAPYATVRKLPEGEQLGGGGSNGRALIYTVRNLLADLDAAHQEIAELRRHLDQAHAEAIGTCALSADKLGVVARAIRENERYEDEQHAKEIAELTARAEAAEKSADNATHERALLQAHGEVVVDQLEAAVQRAETAERERDDASARAEREEIAADLLGAAGDAWELDSTTQDVFTFLAKRIRARGAAGATREPSAPGSLEGAS